MSSVPTRDELLALEGKYTQLEALRRARERGEPIPERAYFKALAERFPGALRELDTLPMHVIEERIVQLRQTLGGESVAPWMAWVAAYHRLMRVALWIKLRTAKDRHFGNERMAFLQLGIADEFGFGMDESFIRNVAEPVGGRIHAVVFARLEGMFGVTEVEIRSVVLGTRNGRPPPNESGQADRCGKAGQEA